VRYTTKGNVRGSCGHQHRSIRTAEKCRQRDAAGCRSQGGYSDRFVVRIDGEPLNRSEFDSQVYYEEVTS